MMGKHTVPKAAPSDLDRSYPAVIEHIRALGDHYLVLVSVIANSWGRLLVERNLMDAVPCSMGDSPELVGKALVPYLGVVYPEEVLSDTERWLDRAIRAYLLRSSTPHA